MEDSMENKIENGGIRYINRSPKRLALWVVITGGAYLIYWHYKNWKYRKQALHTKIRPIGRRIFNIFYCHSLFAKIHDSASKQGYTNLESHRTLATQYVCLMLLSWAVEGSWLGWFLSPLFILIALFPLQKVQRAIAYNNSKLQPSG